MFMKSLSLALLLGSAAWAAEPLSPATHKALAPDLTVNAKGEVALLWVDRAPEEQHVPGKTDNHLSYTDLYVAISRDGGNTFGAPNKINRESGVVWGQQVSRPRIVGTPNGTWHVAYTANEMHPKLGKSALTAHYTRSTDGGATFAPTRRISTLTDADMSAVIHGGFPSAAAFGAMTAAADGSIHVAWIDTRLMKSEADTGGLYITVSRDDGKTFSTDREIYAAGVCPCCQLVAIADGPAGLLLSARQVSAAGNRQASVTRIDAKTGAASKPAETGGAPWQISACPLKPAVLAAHGDTVFAASYNGGEEKPGVYFSVSKDDGATFSRAVPVHPDAAVSDAPAIAVNGRFVMAAWHGKTTGGRRVFTRMYDLTGQPVGGISELPAGPENAQNPVLAARADGKFQIAWQQAERIYTTVLPGAPTDVASVAK